MKRGARPGLSPPGPCFVMVEPSMSGPATTGVRQQADTLYVRIRSLALAFVRDDRGQDLIEYALLTVTIALAGAAVWFAMGPAIASAYTTWGTGINNQWETPDPGGGS